jgi:hypothetical protein
MTKPGITSYRPAIDASEILFCTMHERLARVSTRPRDIGRGRKVGLGRGVTRYYLCLAFAFVKKIYAAPPTLSSIVSDLCLISAAFVRARCLFVQGIVLHEVVDYESGDNLKEGMSEALSSTRARTAIVPCRICWMTSTSC